MMATATDFKAALLVIDVQEDFCPPNGSLAVPGGRDTIPTVNALLELPFALKVATKDWHPPTHVSFATNHAGKRALVDEVVVRNPYDATQWYTSQLWPVHCVRDTPGAALARGLRSDLVHRVVEKGTDERVEMYSAFYDPHRVCDSGLAGLLRDSGVSHVFVVGLAADYCVKATALHAKTEGFVTVVVEEGTRAVDVGGWERSKAELELEGVRVVKEHGEEVGRVRALAT